LFHQSATHAAATRYSPWKFGDFPPTVKVEQTTLILLSQPPQLSQLQHTQWVTQNVALTEKIQTASGKAMLESCSL